jgi:hypothetical protein
MNAPLSLIERLALQTAAPANLPYGFADESGNSVKLVDQWHESQQPASAKYLAEPAHATDEGRRLAAEAVAAARALTPIRLAKRSKIIGLTNWHDTPPHQRRVIARLAGLPQETVTKFDRDLSENEKALLRAAARDLRDNVAALASSL